jgi:hypothetical protein
MAKKSSNTTTVKEKKPKIVRESLLRSFTKQYRHKFIGGYLYIECPIVCTSYIIACDWIPKEEFISEVNIELNKIGRTVTMGCVFSKSDMCYYVVSHLWLAQMYTWCKYDMKLYLEKIFNTMLKNAYQKDISDTNIIVPTSYLEKQKDVEEDKNLKEKRNILLNENHTKEEENEFYKKYGIKMDSYKAMCNDNKTIVENFEEETHVLVFHKFLFNKYKVLLRDTMKVLVDHGIIIQDMNDANYKNNYFLAKEFVVYGFGHNVFDAKKLTTYPVFTKRGLFTVLLLLHDAGVLSKQVIPNLIF